MNDKKKLIADFIEKPSRYEIDIMDGSMLPDKLKDRKELSFVVKPPTINTLSQMAEVLLEIPKEIMEKENLEPKEALKYLDEMVKLFCIMSWAKLEPYPEWYEPFLKANLEGREMFNLFKEMAMKSQTDFFLHSLKMLEAANPMVLSEILTKVKEDSTPTSL